MGTATEHQTCPRPPGATAAVTRCCPQCGYTRSYRSAALADYHHGQHSCTRQEQTRRAADERRARRESGPVRDCTHVRVRHQHGTRNAYVADHCRCPACRQANADAARIRYRDIAYGTWQPHIDAAPARRRIHQLRTAGLGVGQIAAVSGVSRSIIKGLLYGYSRTSGPAQKIRPSDAARILAINPEADHRHPASHTDATGTRRRLQALVALGYPQDQLAAQLQRPISAINTLMRARNVTVHTARTIDQLYRQLLAATPPTLVPERRAEVLRTRAQAARSGWLPPHAWDNIDTDPAPAATPNPEEIAPDPIAIERALFGDPIRLTPTEQAEVIRRLTAQGLSIRDIADRLRTSTRTVSRRREQIAA